MKEIYLAAGCFWGTQAYFDLKEGILKTTVGFANGNCQNPTYEQVCKTETNHAEAVHIVYDENIISLCKILDYFWRVVDPTLLNRQGNDIGTQYRTGIYYVDENDLNCINNSIGEVSKKYDKPIVTEVKPLQYFYPAEEYHQKYLEKNPNGYCHIKL